jgi:hypothetical protein
MVVPSRTFRLVPLNSISNMNFDALFCPRPVLGDHLQERYESFEMNHSSRQIATPKILAIGNLPQYIDVPQNALGPTGRISR